MSLQECDLLRTGRVSSVTLTTMDGVQHIFRHPEIIECVMEKEVSDFHEEQEAGFLPRVIMDFNTVLRLRLLLDDRRKVTVYD